MPDLDKRVLVAGGAGFIGSHVCGKYLEDGWEVVCVDNLSTSKIGNIRHLELDFIKKDVSVKTDFTGDFDLIIDLACPASPLDYLNHPLETMDACSIGVRNLLDLAFEKDAVFMFASTSEIYGDPTVHPQRESYTGNVDTISERSVYSESKRFAETLISTYRRIHGLETRIARIFNTYGPRMNSSDGRAVPNFITQALSNQPVTVYGDGSQTRSFCHIGDTVEALTRLADSGYGKPVNIGNPREYSIKELAEIIIMLTQSESKIKYLPLPKDDPKIRKPDISLASKLLDWEPKTQLREGLIQTIPYYKSC